MTKNKAERELEVACCTIARQKGLAAVKLEKNGNKGIPDYQFIRRGGRSIFVEFKRPGGGGVISPEQQFWADFLGDSHFFVDSVERFLLVIKQLEQNFRSAQPRQLDMCDGIRVKR